MKLKHFNTGFTLSSDNIAKLEALHVRRLLITPSLPGVQARERRAFVYGVRV